RRAVEWPIVLQRRGGRGMAREHAADAGLRLRGGVARAQGEEQREQAGAGRSLDDRHVPGFNAAPVRCFVSRMICPVCIAKCSTAWVIAQSTVTSSRE